MKLADGREFDTTQPIEGVKYNLYDCPGDAAHATHLERGQCNCNGVGPDGLMGSADGSRPPAHLAGCPAQTQHVVPGRVLHSLLSMDVDEGVTPFMVTCPDHGAAAESRFYRVDAIHHPSYFPVRMIWRRPTQGELKRERRDGGEHYRLGGLAREWTPDRPTEVQSWVTSGRHG